MGLKRDAALLRVSRSGKGVNFMVKMGKKMFTASRNDLERFVTGSIESVQFAEIIDDEPEETERKT